MIMAEGVEGRTPPDELESLTSDGDELELPGGRLLRLRIEPDEVSVFDDDVYGSFEWVDARRTNDYGHRVRPDGFDGNAEILRHGHYFDPVWWQPPEGVKRSDVAGFAEFRRLVCDLLEWGFSVVLLELCDADGVVLAGDSIAGVDVVSPEYLRCLRRELWAGIACEGWFDQLPLW